MTPPGCPGFLSNRASGIPGPGDLWERHCGYFLHARIRLAFEGLQWFLNNGRVLLRDGTVIRPSFLQAVCQILYRLYFVWAPDQKACSSSTDPADRPQDALDCQFRPHIHPSCCLDAMDALRIARLSRRGRKQLHCIYGFGSFWASAWDRRTGSSKDAGYGRGCSCCP